MQVILLERVESLGQMGDVVRVKDGFARNFLLPRKKALRATKDNMTHFETQRTQFEAANLKLRQEAEVVAAKMDNLAVTLVRQAGEGGRLYGSVNNRDIADAVTAAGFTIDRRQVLMDNTIKAVGMHKARIALHPEVIIPVTLNVAQSTEEAELQAQGKTRPAAKAAKTENEEPADD